MVDDSADDQDKKLPEESAAVSSEISNRPGISGLLGTILLVLFLVVIIAWIRFMPGAQKTVEIPPPSLPKEENAKAIEQKKDDDLRNSQIKAALDDFLKANYKDWQEQGKNSDDTASDEGRLQVFDIQLVKGDKKQVIKVFVERFQKDDSSEYWSAYQPSNIQQLESTIKSIEKKSDDDSSNDSDNSGNDTPDKDTSDDDN